MIVQVQQHGRVASHAARFCKQKSLHVGQAAEAKSSMPATQPKRGLAMPICTVTATSVFLVFNMATRIATISLILLIMFYSR